jgi:hypothetical protein
MVLALVLALVAGPVAAQTQPNPVVEHYRAYRAALEGQNFMQAEAEAALALAASEARDGDGGSTGVLALNLAMARLLTGDAARALEPANRAVALAEAGAAGVDPGLARLIAGRADLAANGASGAARLRALLANDETLSGIDATEVYLASSELGVWAMGAREFGMAEFAWSQAGAYAEGGSYGRAYGIGRARTLQAAAIVLGEVGRGGSGRIDDDNAQEAYQLLAEAQRVLLPSAMEELPSLELTLAQQAYADARAWTAVLRAKLQSDGQNVPALQSAEGDADGFAELGPPQTPMKRCAFTLDARPLPEYPRSMQRRGALAGITVRLRINEAGDIVESSVVSRVGDEAFAREVEEVTPRWRIVRRDDSPTPCRMQSVLLTSIAFTMAR